MLRPFTVAVRCFMSFPPHLRRAYRRLWSLAWPLMLTNMTVPLLGLVDTAVLGHLDSALYLGAVAVSANLFTLLYWSFGFLRMGTTGLVAQALGAGDDERLRRLLFQAALLGILIGCFLLMLQWLLIPVGLWLMEPAPEVVPLAQEYCRIRIFSAPAVLAQYALIGWLIGRHDTRVPLMVAVATNLLNLALDLLFVVGLGWTSAGVAFATLASEYFALGLTLWLIHQRHPMVLTGRLRMARLTRWSDYRQLLRVNRYIFVRTLALLLTFAFFTAQGARLGTEVVAANAVLLTFLLLISTGLDGFANGAEVLTGEAVGARRHDQLRASLWVSLSCAAGGALLFCAFFLLAGSRLIGLLTDLPAVAALARQFLPWLTLMPALAVWSYLLDGVFIGALRVRAMQNTVLLSALVFLLVWWLSQPLGNQGLWLALSAFMLSRGLSLGWLAGRYTRRQCWF